GAAVIPAAASQALKGIDSVAALPSQGLQIIRNPQMRFEEHDVALDTCAIALQSGGDVRRLLANMLRLRGILDRLRDSGGYSSRDMAFADMTMRIGMMTAALEETVEGWWKTRPLIADASYALLGRNLPPLGAVTRGVDPRTTAMRRERARLDLRRAIL